MIAATDHVRRESRLGFVINAALSALFFLLVFGRTASVPMWGAGGLVVDSLPQGFMVGLMSSLVPGLLARRLLRAGRLGGQTGRLWLPRQLVVRSLLLALLSALGLGLLGGVIAAISGLSIVGWGPALGAKMVTGGLLGALVTRIGLGATLRQG